MTRRDSTLKNAKKTVQFFRTTSVVDVEVTKHAKGFGVGRARITGQEDAELRLAMYTALALMPHRGEIARG